MRETDLEAVLTSAGLAQAAGDLDGAIALASRAVEGEPNIFNGYAILGYCFLHKGEPERAAENLAAAISIEGKVPILHHLLGAALQQLDRTEEAEQAYHRAVQLAPHVVESQIALGQILLKLGNREAAISCFRRAYRLEPNSARGLAQWAKVLTEEAKQPEAEGALRRAISLDPTSPALYALLGDVLMQLGRFAEAKSTLKEAIAIQPGAARPYLHYVQCGRVSQEELPLIERMRAMLSEPGRSLDDRRYLSYALGKALDDLGDFGAAIEHFDEANRIMLLLARPPFSRENHAAQVEFATRSLTREFLETHRSAGSDCETPVFIVGMIRSGTTLVEQILSSHPDLGAAGELQFWLDKTRTAVASNQASIDAASVPGLAAQYLDLLHSLAPGKLRVTDKMPMNFMVLGLIHLAFPKARIIHCRRNPVANCVSIWLTPFSQPVNYAHDRTSIVHWYEDYCRLMEHWRAVVSPDRFLELDYEDLVANRDEVTRLLVDFVGLEWSDACLTPEANPRAVRTPSLWQVRQPVHQDAVERWRNYEPWLGEFRKFLPNSI